MISITFYDIVKDLLFTKMFEDLGQARPLLNKVKHSNRIAIFGYQANTNEECEEISRYL